MTRRESPHVAAVETFLLEYQNRVTSALEEEDGQARFQDDAVHWHRMAKAACDPFGAHLYARYKRACDEYFFLKHRDEPRGIGGLFFDDLSEGGFERSFAFVRSVAEHYLLGYRPILSRRKLHP